MFDKLMAMVETLSRPSPATQDLSQDELKLASAALLIHAAHIDGTVTKEETDKLHDLLRAKYQLSDQEAIALTHAAEKKEQNAVDLYGFTSVIANHLDQHGRQQIVGLLWEIVLADGVLHDYESNLVWRVSELLGVSTRDRVRLRKEVEAARTES